MPVLDWNAVKKEEEKKYIKAITERFALHANAGDPLSYLKFELILVMEEMDIQIHFN